MSSGTLKFVSLKFEKNHRNRDLKPPKVQPKVSQRPSSAGMAWHRLKMWYSQFHKPSPSHHHLLGAMFSIPIHGRFMAARGSHIIVIQP